MRKELKEITSEIDVNQTWLSNFKRYVPVFIAEAKTGQDYKDWDQNILKQFLHETTGHCVSSLQQKCFSSSELEKLLEKWNELAPLFKQLADNQDEPNFKTYQQIKKIIRQCTDGNKWSATRRLIVALQPKLLTTIIADNYFNRFFEYIRSNIEGGDRLVFEYRTSEVDSWYENSYNLFNFFKNNIPHHDVMDIVTYPWQTLSLCSQETDIAPKENTKTEELATLLKTSHQIILQGPPGTGKTRQAKKIANFLIRNGNIEEQCKIIQFHPSYTYEDFVRGIVANTDDGQITYQVENKLLAEFSQKACKNLQDKDKKPEEISKEKLLEQQFKDFTEQVAIDLQEENNTALQLTKSIFIIDIDDEGFRYGGDNWLATKSQRMKFTAIKQAYLDNNQTRQDIRNNTNLKGLAFRHATYTLAILNKFKQYIQANADKYSTSINNCSQIKEKNYVLIIDEINRANLSAVLGETIYALEYRDEKIDSLYALDGDRGIILPSNLYIIGTMNTADRSIGAIDYAVRRRFAFIDILPEPLKELDEGDIFEDILFIDVAKLFIKNPESYFATPVSDKKNAPLIRSEYVTEEFNPLDIMLGHSYFISNDKCPISYKLDYQIKPLLKEYVKDGLLKETAIKIINELTC